MVQRAFRDVDFARPAVSIQPVGGSTLVNLETFYQVEWPRSGVSPGEATSVTLLGRTVRIRPAVRRFVYEFGDGITLGPTPDPGGVYPNGGVRHVYERGGSVQVRSRATYTAEFSVDGGSWQPVDDTVAIDGPPTALRVREARSRLVTDGVPSSGG